jgi:hypothetical protein
MAHESMAYEGVKKPDSIVSPVKTGVQGILTP